MRIQTLQDTAIAAAGGCKREKGKSVAVTLVIMVEPAVPSAGTVSQEKHHFREEEKKYLNMLTFNVFCGI